MIKKTRLLLTFLIVFVLFSTNLTNATPTGPIYWGDYYIYNNQGIPVAKIQERVYFYEDEDLSNPSIYSHWKYSYTLTAESPNFVLYSLHLQAAHPVIHVDVHSTWNYNNIINGFHSWSTTTNPLDYFSNPVINNFALWIEDIYGPNNDGDHGYVPWDVNDKDGNWIAEKYGYEVENVSAPVPEPSALLLLGCGLIGFGIISRIRRKKS